MTGHGKFAAMKAMAFVAVALAPLAPVETARAENAAAVGFGDDSGTWARDGECDDPRFEGAGMGASLDNHLLRDATDCRDAYRAGRVGLRDGADRAGPGDGTTEAGGAANGAPPAAQEGVCVAAPDGASPTALQGNRPALALSPNAVLLCRRIEKAIAEFAAIVADDFGKVDHALEMSEDPDGRIAAAVRGLAAENGGIRWAIGDVLLEATPGADGYEVVLHPPEETSAHDRETGLAVAGTSIGRQQVRGTYAPAPGVWTRWDASWSDISLWLGTSPVDGIGLGIAGARYRATQAETSPGKWSGEGSFRMTGVSVALGSDVVFGLDGVTWRFDHGDADLAFFDSLDRELQAMPTDDIDADGLMPLAAMGRSRAPLVASVSTSMTLNDAFLRDPVSGSEGSVESLSYGGGVRGMDTNQGSVFLEYGHAGLDISLPGPEADLVPTEVDVSVVLHGLAIADAGAMALAFVEEGSRDPSPFDRRLADALPGMAGGLHGRMARAGAGLRIERFVVVLPGTRASLTADIAISEASPAWGTGRARLEVTGMESLVRRVAALADDESRRAAALLALLQAMGERGETAGAVTHSYDLELTPDGRAMLNGNDIGTVMELLEDP